VKNFQSNPLLKKNGGIYLLQVPQTIANLAIAGIKIWVLTGDKQGELTG
jgi:hypothetical protein